MTRIHGLDLARASAIIGMMAAHIGPDHFLTEGYPSVLFAVLAGVSMGIIASRPGERAQARLVLLTRAVILVGLGVLLDAVQDGISVVLIAIGVAYLLLLPVLWWRARWQAVLLGVLVVLGPLVGAVYSAYHVGFGSDFFSDLLFGPYPITAWLAYTLFGLLIHRLALRREVWLLLGGVIVFGAAQSIIAATDFRVGPYDQLKFVGEWLQGEPHSGGLLDVITSAGLAAAVIGVCLLLGRVAAIVWVTYPVRSFGSMSLTIYVTHVIITTIANETFMGTSTMYVDYMSAEQRQALEGLGSGDFGWTMYPPPNGPEPGGYMGFPYVDPLWPDLFVWQLLGFLVFASLWRWKFRRGPAEWAVSRAEVAAAR